MGGELTRADHLESILAGVKLKGLAGGLYSGWSMPPKSMIRGEPYHFLILLEEKRKRELGKENRTRCYIAVGSSCREVSG